MGLHLPRTRLQYRQSGGGSSDRVEIALWEDGNVSKAEWMGSAIFPVEELLGENLALGKESERYRPTGHLAREEEQEQDRADRYGYRYHRPGRDGSSHQDVHFLARPRRRDGVKTDDVAVTRVDPSMFASPVKRLGVSGGTAPFFALRLVDPPDGRTENHYIGKDLSRAVDEIAFYEEMLSIVNSDNEECGLRDLLRFGFEYAGVLTAPEEGVGRRMRRA